MMIGRITLATVAGWALLAASGKAGPLATTPLVAPNSEVYALSYWHGANGGPVVDTHNVVNPGRPRQPDWFHRLSTGIVPAAPGLGVEAVYAHSDMRHLNGPHGEGPGIPVFYRYGLTAPLAPVPVAKVSPVRAATVRHVHPITGDVHWDVYAKTLVVTGAAGQVTGYTGLMTGRHFGDHSDDEPEYNHRDFVVGDAHMIPSVGASGAMGAGGAAVWIANAATGSIDLGVTFLGLSPAEIASAQVRRGTYDNPGDVLFDLPTSLFVDGDGLGTAAQFSTYLDVDPLAALLHGDSFLEIETLTGGFHGQLWSATAGDLNLDGGVDVNDFTTWNEGFGMSFGPVYGDDGTTGRDFLDWQAGFGGGSTARSVSHASAVPEPSTAVLLGMLAMGWSSVWTRCQAG